MSWLVSAKQYIPAVIGEEFGGGYFVGYISHTADGSPTHALIVAPRATGATGTGYTLTTTLACKTANTTTAGTTSSFDGATNTAAMVSAGIANHPAAEFCVNLSIGGFADWYLPSRYELDIAYFNLKPSTAANNTAWGINDYSVPRRIVNNTASYPLQTSITSFATSAEAFTAEHHVSSTETGSTNRWGIIYSTGEHLSRPKVNTNNVRAFRRIAL
jgi:hypothetical protein